MNRREFLRTAGGAAGAATATTAATGSAAAQAGGAIDYKGWLEGAKGWGGGGSTVDKRGKKEVTIQVGVGSSGYAFKPAAVHIDPGTKVIWKWKSGGHNVQSKKGAPAQFKSPVKGKGFTFEKTIKKKGIIPYFCDPHKGMGMKAALAVGGGLPHKPIKQEVDPHNMGVPLQPHYVGIATVLMMTSTLAFAFYQLKYGASAHTKGGND
jgi:halocyanin-like protein